MIDKPTVGWIGAGRMGYALAKRLLDAGYDVAIYNRTRTKLSRSLSMAQRSSTGRWNWLVATSSSAWWPRPRICGR